MNRCFACCEVLGGGEESYHAKCAHRLFGGRTVPTLSYSWSDLNRLAEQIVKRSVALPGVQAKLSLHLDQQDSHGRDRLTLVGLEGEYILKPPAENYPEMPELEHLCMLMADRIGVETAACGLILLSSGERAFITRRMDRTHDGVRHMEDFCQLTDKLTEHKYRSSMEQVGKTVLKFSSNPGFDAQRLFEITIYCFITGNADMHLKNFSILHEIDGMIRLSPAYDLLPTKLLTPKDQEELALPVNGKKSNLRRKDMDAFGKSIGLTEKQISNTHERLKDRFTEVEPMITASFATKSTQKRLLKLIHERSARFWP